MKPDPYKYARSRAYKIKHGLISSDKKFHPEILEQNTEILNKIDNDLYNEIKIESNVYGFKN